MSGTRDQEESEMMKIKEVTTVADLMYLPVPPDPFTSLPFPNPILNADLLGG